MPYPDGKSWFVRDSRPSWTEKTLRIFRTGWTHLSLRLCFHCPHFALVRTARPRTNLVAIDGSRIYQPFPGRLPDTHVGAVSLGVVIIDLHTLETLPKLPASGSVDPRELRKTEKGSSLGAMLPGTNARTNDGVEPREWFRQIFNNTLQKASLSGTETFVDTLYHLLGTAHKVGDCPNVDCDATQLPLART